ncbi:Alpha/Beta hydrolase protein [Microdochium trichocladiopsis]|uniref:alcohol O-acetyltransferase n=1 Tax=Microdochium trichocladiopsis TaxID=1682393 RepID=A0A9P8YBQ3_9PEZI|nr:Alpha/Beta hydrolase protein [Microdochium trichocladiopsis]KAH7033262.1 Alpha/Beta hydrolase protein [Microdochium trichocladiopsis]
MDWLGRAYLNFTTAPESLQLTGKDGAKTDLLTVVKETVPPCNLNPLLFNGHLQTCWTAFGRAAPATHYKRRIFEADHAEFNGSYAVDFVNRGPEEPVDPSLPPRTAYFSDEEKAAMGSEDSRPMLVVLHGLSGGSHEVYLRHAIAPLADSGEWEVCVVNSRGCANSKITTGILYNARATWDVRQTVKWLRKTYPNRPLFGLGFSLGACILTNYIAEEGASCNFKAAIVCANPWSLDISHKMLSSSFIGHHLYQRVLGTAMRKLAADHKEEIIKYTNVDYETLTTLTYLHEFDRAYQCPTWGYPTEDAYYRDASSNDSLLAVRIPLLCLNAEDDPIASKWGLPRTEAAQNPYTVLCTTSLGGHIGWFELGGGRWHAKPIFNFFNRMAFEIEAESISHDQPLHQAPRKKDAGYSPTHFEPLRRKMQVKLD